MALVADRSVLLAHVFDILSRESRLWAGPRRSAKIAIEGFWFWKSLYKIVFKQSAIESILRQALRCQQGPLPKDTGLHHPRGAFRLLITGQFAEAGNLAVHAPEQALLQDGLIPLDLFVFSVSNS